MFPPEPFKVVCPKCNDSKVVKPKSDVLDPRDWYIICSKCKVQMQRTELNVMDEIGSIFK